MFLSTVIPSSKLNINAKNVDPYQFTLPYNFVRGRTICLEFNPVFCSADGATNVHHRNLMKIINGVENRLIITIPTDVTTHTANMTIAMYGFFGQQTQEWRYNINITCDTINNTITFTPVSYTHLQGTVYRQYVDDWHTWPVLLTIHTKL